MLVFELEKDDLEKGTHTPWDTKLVGRERIGDCGRGQDMGAEYKLTR
jgi:hypothetical protein